MAIQLNTFVHTYPKRVVLFFFLDSSNNVSFFLFRHKLYNLTSYGLQSWPGKDLIQIRKINRLGYIYNNAQNF